MAATVKRLAKKIVSAPEEAPPTVSSGDWIKSQLEGETPKTAVVHYLKSLFPVIQWAPNYNIGWLYGDVVAGLTVGLVLIPQSMSYARLATLPTEYGLYASFVGVFIYCFFATSKDVSIGPVAVMSLEVANIIKWGNVQIAVTLSFICGFIVLGIGLLRIGWIVEFIPTPAVAGFMTGSAITIVSSQVPGLFGIQNLLDTRTSAYKVIINTLKNLGHSKKDAAFGVTGLFALYFIRWIFDYLGRRYPNRARTFFYLSVMRNAFVLIILTLAAWGVVRYEKPDKKGNYSISILKTVPRGFKHIGQPTIDAELLKGLGSHLFVATLILLLEHIAISKSFGRINGYKINPNQELIAIGVTNTIGTLFAAYPATGSFSRSALKSKCGVRTPAAGWVTGLVVIVALYGLTDAFFFIPTAGLSAIIVHAVADLVTPPSQVYRFWLISPLEFLIWAAAVLVSIFSSIENGIYTSVAASLVLLLIRVARPGGQFLGKVKVHGDDNSTSRDVFVPLEPKGGLRNPHIIVEPAAPGVFIFRLEESFTFPNSSLINSTVVDHIKEHTRRGKDVSLIRLIDRPWNDPGPRRGAAFDPKAQDTSKPLLKAVVLDFAAVGNIDTTGVQNLIDTRKELENWADGPVEFHFANILSPWVRRGLVAGGFGTGKDVDFPAEVAPVVPNQSGDYADPDHQTPHLRHREEWISKTGTTKTDKTEADVESGDSEYRKSNSPSSSVEGPLLSTLTPFFHVDLASAVRVAEARAKRST
ncbi:Probable sulfate permease C869.05c [Serendipita indica DSM 11827]|nr:Probable sulfate permease C869.05c [Serendipita indica DSM 11827]